MSVRATSIECYHQIKEEGLLNKRRFEAYEAIYTNGPCTSAEAMRNRLNGRNVLSQSRARFTELRNLGVIYEKGIKQCSVTGRNAIEWELTNKLPKNKKPPITQKQERINKAITALRKLYRTRLNATDRDWQTVANLIKSI